MSSLCKSVKEIGDEFGISRIMLQRYERIGLVCPSGRNKYGYLLYDGKTVNRIVFIRHLQNCGFKLPEIKELLALSVIEIKEALKRRAEELQLEARSIVRLVAKTREIVDVLEEADVAVIAEIILKENE